MNDTFPLHDEVVLFKNKNECCGCTACFAICPKSAISMLPDEEGFVYPLIDKRKCIGCYQCIKVCPIRKRNSEKEMDEN